MASSAARHLLPLGLGLQAWLGGLSRPAGLRTPRGWASRGLQAGAPGPLGAHASAPSARPSPRAPAAPPQREGLGRGSRRGREAAEREHGLQRRAQPLRKSQARGRGVGPRPAIPTRSGPSPWQRAPAARRPGRRSKPRAEVLLLGGGSAGSCSGLGLGGAGAEASRKRRDEGSRGMEMRPCSVRRRPRPKLPAGLRLQLPPAHPRASSPQPSGPRGWVTRVSDCPTGCADVAAALIHSSCLGHARKAASSPGNDCISKSSQTIPLKAERERRQRGEA